MKKLKSPQGFTLIELLVVITIIAILAGIAMPAFTTVIDKGNQTKALANAKQIHLGLKMFAGDYDGIFPSYPQKAGNLNDSTSALVEDSNAAFNNLVPNYIPTEKVFWMGKSAFCKTTPPTDDFSNVTNILAKGTNTFAYVRGLNDTSTPSWPLIADGFSTLASWNYSVDGSSAGGVWKGKAAVVIRVDGSGKVEVLNSVDHTVRREDKKSENLFKQEVAGANTPGWLTGTDTKVVNPLARE